MDRQRPPYVPTGDAALLAMLDCANPLEHELVFDLGCGDGRLLIESCARYQTRGIGVEIDAEVAALAQKAVDDAELGESIDIEVADLFDVELEDADIVFVYLNQYLMAQLEEKFEHELEGARVVSHHFELPHKKPSAVSQQVRGSRVFLYEY